MYSLADINSDNYDVTERAALTRMNLIVRACNDVTTHRGGGGDRHLVDRPAVQVVNGAGVGRRIAGQSASIGAHGPGGVVV